MADKKILIGEISTAHGIKGFVKVRSFVEDDKLLERAIGIKIKLKNKNGDAYIAEVEGITDRNEAEKLRGTKLYIDRTALPETKDGEFYTEDLKGLRVINQNNETVGIVLSVQNFGAGDILDVKSDNGASFYLPLPSDGIVDFEHETITVNVPEVM